MAGVGDMSAKHRREAGTRSSKARRAGVVPLNHLHLDNLTLLGDPLRLTLWRGIEHARDPVEHVAIASVRDVADFWRREKRVADQKDSVPYYSRGYYPTRRGDEPGPAFFGKSPSMIWIPA